MGDLGNRHTKVAVNSLQKYRVQQALRTAGPSEWSMPQLRAISLVRLLTAACCLLAATSGSNLVGAASGATTVQHDTARRLLRLSAHVTHEGHEEAKWDTDSSRHTLVDSADATSARKAPATEEADAAANIEDVQMQNMRRKSTERTRKGNRKIEAETFAAKQRAAGESAVPNTAAQNRPKDPWGDDGSNDEESAAALKNGGDINGKKPFESLFGDDGSEEEEEDLIGASDDEYFAGGTDEEEDAHSQDEMPAPKKTSNANKNFGAISGDDSNEEDDGQSQDEMAAPKKTSNANKNFGAISGDDSNEGQPPDLRSYVGNEEDDGHSQDEMAAPKKTSNA